VPLAKLRVRKARLLLRRLRRSEEKSHVLRHVARPVQTLKGQNVVLCNPKGYRDLYLPHLVVGAKDSRPFRGKRLSKRRPEHKLGTAESKRVNTAFNKVGHALGALRPLVMAYSEKREGSRPFATGQKVTNSFVPGGCGAGNGVSHSNEMAPLTVTAKASRREAKLCFIMLHFRETPRTSLKKGWRRCFQYNKLYGDILDDGRSKDPALYRKVVLKREIPPTLLESVRAQARLESSSSERRLASARSRRERSGALGPQDFSSLLQSISGRVVRDPE